MLCVAGASGIYLPILHKNWIRHGKGTEVFLSAWRARICQWCAHKPKSKDPYSKQNIYIYIYIHLRGSFNFKHLYVWQTFFLNPYFWQTIYTILYMYHLPIKDTKLIPRSGEKKVTLAPGEKYPWNKNAPIIESILTWGSKFSKFWVSNMSPHKFPQLIRSRICFGGGAGGETTVGNTQGIVGCTPTNVPLWEIPI